MSLTRRVVVRKNLYYDSVFLMAVSGQLAKEPGIEGAAAVMGTEANRKTLVEMGYDVAQFADAGPNDLLVAVAGQDDAVRAVADDIDRWLVRREDAVGAISVPTWEAAEQRIADANLAVISVPGAYAAREAERALDRGLNVFLFSDHVTVEDELALKQKATERGLLVMGPDCGTALVAGKGIGFANNVRRGPIGVVASSGTGLQEFSSLAHRAGSGISHALGTGSRDLSDAIGGLSTVAALRALERDRETHVIAVISKPPGTRALATLVTTVKRSAKPVVLCLLGLRPGDVPQAGGATVARTLDEAARLALEEAGIASAAGGRDAAAQRGLDEEIARLSSGQRYLRGLFAGGTFCYQAQQIVRDAGIAASSNAPIAGMLELADARTSREHTLVDLGADEFTEGRPHPMIDASQRTARILAEARDPEVAMLLVDVVLGHNAAADPAGDIVPAIRSARQATEKRGGHLIVLASVCGTDQDPQGLASQEETLAAAGARVFESSAQAAEAAVHILAQIAKRGHG